MADREKLIELLSQDKAYPDCDKCKTPVGHCNRCVLEIHADHLIANGVTVRERGRWIYEEEPDDDNNIKAMCSVCFAGDKHATALMHKVPYCWKCGADMRGEEDGK